MHVCVLYIHVYIQYIVHISYEYVMCVYVMKAVLCRDCVPACIHIFANVGQSYASGTEIYFVYMYMYGIYRCGS